VKQRINDAVFKNSIFAWIALATAAILMVPFLAMWLTPEVRWDATDFIVMGSLLFGTASLFVLAARRVTRERRLLVGLLCLAVFLYIWAELAVGVFTSLGA
jgi:hypothetical protein